MKKFGKTDNGGTDAVFAYLVKIYRFPMAALSMLLPFFYFVYLNLRVSICMAPKTNHAYLRRLLKSSFLFNLPHQTNLEKIT